MDSIYAACQRGMEAFRDGVELDENPYATESYEPRPGCTMQQLRAWQHGWEVEQRHMCELAQ